MAGKILIVDDVATNRIVLKVKLSSARYDILQADTGAEALRIASQDRPDLILLNVQLAGMDGLETCRRLKRAPASAAIPVILVSNDALPATRLAALRAGADDLFVKPLDELVLLARMRSLLRNRETDAELQLHESTCRALGFAEANPAFDRPARIALVAPSRETGMAWRAALVRRMARDQLLLLTREEALALPQDRDLPDAYLLAADLTAPGEGLRLMSELRSRSGSRHAVICIALPDSARDTAAVALDLGASDLLPLDLGTSERADEAVLRLRAQLARKRVADRKRESVADGLRLAVTDPLTGLYNRRYAMPHLARIAERARQTGRSFAVMVLDLDRFKAINDTYGHAAGDCVLVKIAHRLGTNLREVDLLARIGGEEFLIALPDTTPEAAQIAADRIRRLVQDRPASLGAGCGTIPVTVSIGLAMGGPDHEPVEDLVARADQALLGAKVQGRNRIAISRHPDAA